MKRILFIVFSILFIFAFTSCARAAETQAAAAASPVPAATPVPSAEPSAALPNPVVEVEGYEDFYALGFVITPFEGADSIRYSIIDNTIAQIIFTTDGDTYTYRAAMTNSDISGVYETFDALPQSLDLQGAGFEVTVLIRTVDGGDNGALAEWEYDGVRYSLYTPDHTGYEALTDVLLPIVYADLPFATCCG